MTQQEIYDNIVLPERQRYIYHKNIIIPASTILNKLDIRLLAILGIITDVFARHLFLLTFNYSEDKIDKNYIWQGIKYFTYHYSNKNLIETTEHLWHLLDQNGHIFDIEDNINDYITELYKALKELTNDTNI